MDKNICNSWQCLGVLTECFSAATSPRDSEGSLKTGKGGNKSGSDSLDIRSSTDALGDPELVRIFVDSGILETEIIRVVLLCIFCGKQRVDALSAKEKESFSKFCLKSIIVFGLQLVHTACSAELPPFLSAGGSAWRAALAASEPRKFTNAIKKCFR